jgi:predicted cupin superfamily sugar epimerase
MPVPTTASYWIQKLELQPHPEGGFYRQTYRADLLLPKEALPNFKGPRPAATAIFFLLDEQNFSAFHRLQSDELWHFYLGASLIVHVIEPNGIYSCIPLGSDPEAGEVLQAVVKAGCWFASEVRVKEVNVTNETGGRSFALVGCTVSPGFDFEDFELGNYEELVQNSPQHIEIIGKLTRR